MTQDTDDGALAVLRRARARIADPEHWTQGEEARGKSGRGVAATSKYAVRWCGSGAAVAEGAGWWVMRLLRDAGDHNDLVSDINDEQGHAAVLALYDAAIARLEAEDA